jgi:hypothetical protein
MAAGGQRDLFVGRPKLALLGDSVTMGAGHRSEPSSTSDIVCAKRSDRWSELQAPATPRELLEFLKQKKKSTSGSRRTSQPE